MTTATTGPRRRPRSSRSHASKRCINGQHQTGGSLAAAAAVKAALALAVLLSTVASAAETSIYSTTAQASTAGFSTALTPEENSKTCLAGKGTAVEPNVLRVAATKWQ